MKIRIIIFFIGLLFMSYACRNSQNKDLATIEKQELATGIRHDSLFMGLHFGMTQQAFKDVCWDMNHKGLFTEGGNMTVEYSFGKKNFNFPLRMNFYPQFKDDKIIVMPIQFTYTDTDLSFPNGQTQKLLKDVKSLMEEWYGTGFFVTPLPKGEKEQKAYAKVSGNRRVLIFSEREFEVMVIVTDLTAGQ